MRCPAAHRYAGCIAFLFCVFSPLSVAGFDAKPLWRQSLGGKIDVYPAQGPGGDVYVIADDRALHSINPRTGESHWIYRPGGRLLNLLLVAPDGTIYIQNDRQELFAVTPGGTGRWKLLMKLEVAALPATAPDGRLVLPLVGGRIICISRYGVILWKRDEPAEASAAPVVDLNGTFWVPLTDGRIIGLNTWGEAVDERTGVGPVSVLALDASDRLWAGGFSGSLMVFNKDRWTDNDSTAQTRSFKIPSKGARVTAIFTDTDNHGHIFYNDGTFLRVSDNGIVLSQDRIAMSGSPVQTENSTLFVPAFDGSIQVLESTGKTTILRSGTIFTEPLITEGGILIAGGGDWVLYGWDTGSLPGRGWKQSRGSSRRSGALLSKPIAYDRSEARQYAGFVVREHMARSNDISERLMLVEELENLHREDRMYRELPWVRLLLEDLAAPGTMRQSVLEYPSLISHGLVRERAYQLLGNSQDFRVRFFIQECLSHEDDPRALAAGFRALGRLGTDWDGASLRLIAKKYRNFPQGDAQLTLAVAIALVDLIRYNGKISDPIGYRLLDDLVRHAGNQAIHKEVMRVMRRISGLQNEIQ